MAPLQWGIIGSGKISTDFCIALKTLEDETHSIKAIGASTVEKACQFAKKFSVDRFYGTYEELVSDMEVDVVYIGTINSTHRDLTVLALKNGKHVLCEKPAACNSEQLGEILQMAQEKKLFYMEAMWSRLMPVYRDLDRLISEGHIGKIKAATVTFGSEALKSVERVMDPKLDGSVMMDIGIYAVNFLDIAFSGHRPDQISAIGFPSASGVDLTSSITFLYERNGIGQMLVTGDVNMPNEGIIIGTKGQIVVKAPFWCPTIIDVNGEVTEHMLPETAFPTNFCNSAGLRFEAEHVRICLENNFLESDIVTHDTSRRIMSLLDEIRLQLKKSHHAQPHS